MPNRLVALGLLLSIAAAPCAFAEPAATEVAVLPFVVPPDADASLGYRFWLGAVQQLYAEPNLHVWRDGAIGRTLWATAGPADGDLNAALLGALTTLGADWVLTGTLRIDEAGLPRCTGIVLKAGAEAPTTTPEYVIETPEETSRAVSEMSTHLAALVTGGAPPAPAVPDEQTSIGVSEVGAALDAAVRATLTGEGGPVRALANDLVHRAASVLTRDEVSPPSAAFEDLLRSALALSPAHAGAVVLLGNIHLSRSDFSAALAAFGWADEISPGLPGMAELLADIPASRASGAKIAEWRFAALDLARAACQPVLIGAEAPPAPSALSSDVLGARLEGQVALYEFATHAAAAVPNLLAPDATTGALILPAEGAAWSEAGGLAITGQGVCLRTEGTYSALADAMKATSEFSVEVLITPDDAEHSGPARIVSFSADTAARNFTLGQDADKYVLRLRTTETDQQGTPAAETPAGALKPQRQHVVATYANGAVRLYVDGALSAEMARAGGFDAWSADYRLVVGNEDTLDRQWNGVIELAALYNRALRPDEIAARCAAFLPAP